jgi:hypothetical protein
VQVRGDPVPDQVGISAEQEIGVQLSGYQPLRLTQQPLNRNAQPCQAGVAGSHRQGVGGRRREGLP